VIVVVVMAVVPVVMLVVERVCTHTPGDKHKAKASQAHHKLTLDDVPEDLGPWNRQPQTEVDAICSGCHEHV
jgi:hypothetical protein